MVTEKQSLPPIFRRKPTFVPIGPVIDSCPDRVCARRRHPLLLYDWCRILVGSEFGGSFEGIVRGTNLLAVPGNPNVKSVERIVEVE